MTAILAVLFLLALALTVAIGIGRFLAKCEARVEPTLTATRRPQPEPAHKTLHDAHSLYARLLRAAIEGPKDEGER
jgi:hypothetical protein